MIKTLLFKAIVHVAIITSEGCIRQVDRNTDAYIFIIDSI